MIRTETVHFPGHEAATVCHVSQQTPAAEIVAALNLAKPAALVCFNGGTAEWDEALASRFEATVEALAQVAADKLLMLITGGTDAGIFSMLGRAVEKLGQPVTLVGVAPAGLVRWPGGGAGETDLEPHHRFFVLVEGENWGDETATMYALANEWGRECPSVAVFAGGGKITLREMQANVAQGRQMILVAGSGRSTDEVLAAREGSVEPVVGEIAGKGKITPFDLREAPQGFAELLVEALWPRERDGRRICDDGAV